MVEEGEGTGMKKQNKNKIKEGNRAVTAVLYILAAIAAFITLYPMYYVLILSLSEPAYAATMRVYLVPKGFNLSAFQVLVTDMKMWRAYANTVLYVVPTTILMIATSTVVAFGLNYKKLMGRKFLTMFLLIPMYFAGGTIPSFLLIVKLGLYDSPFSQVIPACFSIWNIILVKAYFRSIPESLTEAARIDGEMCIRDSMWTGQELGAGLDLSGFIGSLLLGGIILGIYKMCIRDRRQPGWGSGLQSA